MSRKVKVGIIQVQIPEKSCGISEMQDILFSLGEECLKKGADIVLFPEAFQYIFHREIKSDPEKLTEVTEKWQKRLSELAKKYRSYIVPWDYFYEDGKCYNTSYILDRNGEFVGRYKKCNLTYSELQTLTNGNEYPVFDLDFGKVGIMICFDNYFPESAAALGAKGAELVLYPLYGDTLLPQWELKCRTRAADHSFYLLTSQNDKYYSIAYSGLIDNEGNVIKKLTSPLSTEVVEIDLDKKVITHLSGVIPTQYEDLKNYLHKCRNYKAFAQLAQEGYKPKDWDEIFKDAPKE